MATLLKDFVQALPSCRYRLKGDFAHWFRANLPLLARNDSRKGADVLADALFLLGRQWAIIEFGNLPTRAPLHEQFLLNTWKEVDVDWNSFCGSGGPIGEAWLHTLAADNSLGEWSDENPHQVRVWLHFNTNRTRPPAVSLKIEGKGALIFMKYWMNYKRNRECDSSALASLIDSVTRRSPSRLFPDQVLSENATPLHPVFLS